MNKIGHLRENYSGAKQHRIAFKLSFSLSASIKFLHAVFSESSGDWRLASKSEAKTAQKCKHLFTPFATGTFQHPIQRQHIP
jgi:hypothetical protein